MYRALVVGFGILLGLNSLGHAGEPKEHIVKIVSDYENLRMYFKPKTILIKPGDTVTWVNVAAEEHNVLVYPDGFPKGAKPFASHYMTKEGEKWSHTFKVKGSYEYHCIPHLPMGMHGTVIVARPSAEEEYHIPTITEMQAYTKRLREYFEEDEFKYKPRKKRADAAPADHSRMKHASKH
ncbi:MAG: plastocyanin/azurin family copper-binding protein [Rhodospirillaceae bacterium]|nr:plastocyanin/azurin family copper-binding protein [Rhodospirillaceae bacterium]